MPIHPQIQKCLVMFQDPLYYVIGFLLMLIELKRKLERFGLLINLENIFYFQCQLKIIQNYSQSS